jgi:hypothetical protein
MNITESGATHSARPDGSQMSSRFMRWKRDVRICRDRAGRGRDLHLSSIFLLVSSYRKISLHFHHGRMAPETAMSDSGCGLVGDTTSCHRALRCARHQEPRRGKGDSCRQGLLD